MSNDNVWVTGKVMHKGKKSISAVLLDKFLRGRTVTVPLSIITEQKRIGEDDKLCVPKWWVHKNKLCEMAEAEPSRNYVNQG